MSTSIPPNPLRDELDDEEAEDEEVDSFDFFAVDERFPVVAAEARSATAKIPKRAVTFRFISSLLTHHRWVYSFLSRNERVG